MSRVCEDNGIQIEFPDGNWTQLDGESCETTMGKFSGIFGGFKIMDCAWYDTENNVLWLIELKRYYDAANKKYIEPDLTDPKIRGEKLEEFVQKIIGTLLLFNDRYQALMECFPENAVNAEEVNIVFILHIKGGHKQFLNALNGQLSRRYKKFRAVFGQDGSILILDTESAGKKLPFTVKVL